MALPCSLLDAVGSLHAYVGPILNVVPSYRTGIGPWNGEEIGMRSAVLPPLFLGSLAKLSDDWSQWAPPGRCPVTYIKPLYPIFSASLPPDASFPPAYLFQVACTWTLLKVPWVLFTSTLALYLIRSYVCYVPPLRNGLSYFPQKLVVIGGTVEIARRASAFAWNGFVDCWYPLWK